MPSIARKVADGSGDKIEVELFQHAQDDVWQVTNAVEIDEMIPGMEHMQMGHREGSTDDMGYGMHQ
jgi:hypothetical protein